MHTPSIATDASRDLDAAIGYLNATHMTFTMRPIDDQQWQITFDDAVVVLDAAGIIARAQRERCAHAAAHVTDPEPPSGTTARHWPDALTLTMGALAMAALVMTFLIALLSR